MGRTPYYWVIVNANPAKSKKIPPLLAKFLALPHQGTLPSKTQKDILDALYETNNDYFFQQIRANLSDFVRQLIQSTMFTDAASQPKLSLKTTSRTSGGAEFRLQFTIPRFTDRILVDKEIILHQFLAIGVLFTPLLLVS